MCVCGCKDYLSQGKEVVMTRALELVQRLGITVDNLKSFEYAESMCSLLAPKASLFPEGEDVWEVVQTMQRFHEALRSEKYRLAVKSAREVFSRLPSSGKAKEILSLYQQLEQLHHTITDEMIENLKDSAIKALFKKMRNFRKMHEECRAELIQQYNL